MVELQKSSIFSPDLSSVTKDEKPTYYLMLKDTPLMKVKGADVEVLNRGLLPIEIRGKSDIGYDDFSDWLRDRVLPLQREHAKDLLNGLGLSQQDRKSVALACKGLSLIDCYWVRKGEEDKWANVNLFDNKFSEAVGRLAFTGSSKISVRGKFHTPELTGQGAYAKCWKEVDGKLYLYKSNTPTGFESEAEYAVSNLLEAAGIPHVTYELLEHEGRIASRCETLTNHDVMIVPAANVCAFFMNQKRDWVEQVKMYWREEFYQMLVIDYIIDNKDRHFFNWGFYFKSDTGEVLGLHPLFDHNCAMQFKQQHFSQMFDGKTMRQVARVHYRKLEDKSFVKRMRDYLDNPKVKKEFKKLFKSDLQWTKVKERCDELLSLD